VEVLEALRAVEVRWKALREVELATPRSMLLWVAFKAVFLNIAGFSVESREEYEVVHGRIKGEN
jgi:hypothetical protein